MTMRQTVRALAWLISDTFRQALATRMFWIVLAVSLTVIALCASIQIDGDVSLRSEDPADFELYGRDGQPLGGPNLDPARIRLAFGAIDLPVFRDGGSQVHHLQSLLAVWVAGAVGTLLCLVWTAGFLPEFLQPASIAVLLAKPVPRPILLLGKYLGVLAFVTLHAGLFVLGTWIALGASTGSWDPRYLISFPLLLLHFAAIYAVSVLLATLTRNAAASLFGTIVVWMVGLGTNYGRHMWIQFQSMTSDLSVGEPSPALGWIAEVGYWILPKPADLAILLDRALQTSDHFLLPTELLRASQSDAFCPGWTLASQALFAVVVLSLAAWQFRETDY